mmetsp:Transcript_17787/g.15698  ORF Transcript_17787/g.15698 Transcript_17787/m.15698 type:complete len:142 (+) Transcript_17787:264-689(+)
MRTNSQLKTQFSEILGHFDNFKEIVNDSHKLLVSSWYSFSFQKYHSTAVLGKDKLIQTPYFQKRRETVDIFYQYFYSLTFTQKTSFFIFSFLCLSSRRHLLTFNRYCLKMLYESQYLQTLGRRIELNTCSSQHVMGRYSAF